MGTRVLVVDDATEMRTLFRTAMRLDHPEVEVSEAASAEAALELIVDLRPDAVIVDEVMPGMPGLELVGRVRRMTPEARIVLFSSVPYGEIAARALDEGADFVVEKTAGHESVLAALGLD